MELETNRLLLKEISPDDLEDIHRLHSYPEVDEFNTLGIPENIETTTEIIHMEDNSEGFKRFHWAGRYDFIAG